MALDVAGPEIAPNRNFFGMHILFIDETIQPEMSLIAEDDFTIKVRIIFKLLLSSIQEHTTLLVVKRLQFLRQFDFVSM